MSAFLGPIHFWLYNKIGRQEELTKAMASLACEKGWIPDADAYVNDLPALENAIDESNIHGWLQERIHDAETRYAGLIATVTEGHDERMEEILCAAKDFGKASGIGTAPTPSKVYRVFEDFFVNGMPCDRVNEVITENEEEVSWQMLQDIHAQYWNGNAARYYAIRRSVMEGMLDGTGYVLASSDDAHYSIQKMG